MTDRRPADGVAVVLHLVEAVRADHRGGCAPECCGGSRLDPCSVSNWLEELDRYLVREVPDEPAGWAPRRWRELVEGDRVSLGGVEADVLGAQTLGWHVDPKSNEYRPQPLEHEITHVRLKRDGHPEATYKMPPDGEVETLRGELGQEVDRLAGHHAGDVTDARDAVLAGWAADAVSTLRAAGLNPESIR